MPLCEEKTITEARTMDKSELIEKLKKMRLPVIAEHNMNYKVQTQNTVNYRSMNGSAN